MITVGLLKRDRCTLFSPLLKLRALGDRKCKKGKIKLKSLSGIGRYLSINGFFFLYT